MSDKRSVSTDALDTLGTAPLDDTAKRDAIHLAVEPVIAGEGLNGGAWVVLRNGVAYAADEDDENILGIVDPFITGTVQKGQRFWFILKPREVRSLRHVWTHPAFPDEPAVGALPVAVPDKAASEAWLRDWVAKADCPSYERVMAAVSDGDHESSWDSEYFHFDGRDAHGEIPPEFWGHAEVVLGKKLEHRPKYFSCSC